MLKVLVVEAANFSTALSNAFLDKLGFEAICVDNRADAIAVLDAHAGEFFLSLVDFDLPDGPNGEAVDLVQTYGVPSIVLTNTYDEAVSGHLVAKKVIDYVAKDSPTCLDDVMALADRVRRNRLVKALVVDSAADSRRRVVELLKTSLLDVVEAENGVDALAQLTEHPEIKLVVTVCDMPVMDGFELVKHIRAVHSRDKLAVIGVSSQDNKWLSAKFIKFGADDFVTTPLLPEELLCRVSRNLQRIEQIAHLNEVATVDFLTGLYNRRFIIDMGQKLFANVERKNINLTVSILDIDHFKQINDNFGHDAGDLMLQITAGIIKDHFHKGDYVARLGGEEFCVLAVNMDPAEVPGIFEALRKKIEKRILDFGGGQIGATISIGICAEPADSLDDMFTVADRRLYDAKTGGRNRVVFEDAPVKAPCADKAKALAPGGYDKSAKRMRGSVRPATEPEGVSPMRAHPIFR